jgi:CysZ protein
MAVNPSIPTPEIPATATAARDFAAGIACVFNGLRMLITHRSLWGYCIVSALVMAVLLVSALTFTIGRVDDWLGAVWARPDGAMWAILWYLAAIGVALAVGYLALVASIAAAGIVLAPLHDRLSEKVERLVEPRPDEKFDAATFVGDVGTGIAHTVLNLVLFLAIGVPVVLLNLVPGIGSLVSAAVGAVFTGFMLAMEMSDYALSRRRLTWRAKWGVIRRRPWLFLGFGLTLAALLWIPFAGAVTVPASVISGTLLVLAVERSGLVNAES